MSVTESNAIRDELALIRDNLCMTWREIATMPKYQGIPIQTLSMIYLGKRGVPKKYRERLGLPTTQPAPVCPEHGVVHVGKCPKKLRPPRHQLGWLMSFYETKEWDKVIHG